MKKNLCTTLALAACLVLSFTVPALAQTGWVRNGDAWNYYNKDGEMAKSQWVKNGESLFWIDENGFMAVNAWHETDGVMYWLDGSGAAATGWKEIDSKWYYFQEESHAMATECYVGSHYVGEDGAWVVGK